MSEYDGQPGEEEFVPGQDESPRDKHNREAIYLIYQIYGSLENGSVVEDIESVPSTWKCIFSGVSYDVVALHVVQKMEQGLQWCVTPCFDPDGIVMFDKVSLFAEPGTYQYDDPTMTQRRTRTGTWLTALKDIE